MNTSDMIAMNFCKNVIHYAKQSDGLGKLEEGIGVRKGYFSRKIKNGNVPLNKALKCSEILDIDMTRLLYEDERLRRIQELEDELKRMKSECNEKSNELESLKSEYRDKREE